MDTLLKNQSNDAETDAIDCVILWVDGNDPEHFKKRQAYIASAGKKPPAQSGNSRFGQINEIEYTCSSILRFIPWVRNIYIVTDNQIPEFLKEPTLKHDAKEKIKVIDHAVIFKGFEQHLPTFNTRTLQAMIWRIPGLSEKFIYFDDDIMLCRPQPKEAFFRNNIPVTAGQWALQTHLGPIGKIKSFIKQLRGKINSKARASHTLGQEKSAQLARMKLHFLRLPHTPKPLLKSMMASFYDSDEKIEQQIKDRFRTSSQHNPIALATYRALKKNVCLIDNQIEHILFKTETDNTVKTNKKLHRASQSEKVGSICIQSLDQGKEDVKAMTLDWLDTNIGRLS